MKRVLRLGLAALAVAVLAVGVGHAQQMKFWRIGTGGAGGTYFPIGGLIANALSNPPGSRPCNKGGACGVPGLVAIAVSTNASVANVNAINAGQLDADFFDRVMAKWCFAELVNRDRPRERMADVRLIEAEVLSRAEVARRDGADPEVMRQELRGENPKKDRTDLDELESEQT